LASDQQGREYTPLAGRAEVHQPAVGVRLDIAEHAEPHGHRDHPSTARSTGCDQPNQGFYKVCP